MNSPDAALRARGGRRERLAILLLLGFASGLPLPLTDDTMKAWLKDAGVDLARIGLLGLVAFPYTLKFLWAPFMDRFVPPFLGRRRGWLAVTQVLLAVAIATLGFMDPAGALPFFVAVALAIAFASASQDIVADAYRTDVSPPDERGAAASAFVTGYRFAMIAAGAGALILADRFGSWKPVYLVMAGGMVVGAAATLFAKEPAAVTAPPTLREAVIEPFRDLALRRGGWFALLFIVLFKLPDVVAGAMTVPFMLSIGITKTDIGTIRQGLGLLITILGTLAGGAISLRMGLKKSLWVFGILQAVSNLGFLVLASTGPRYGVLVGVIAVENFCNGLVSAGFVAFLMSQCDRRFSATQYALLSSVMAITRVVAGAPTGYMAETLGWSGFFVASIATALPGMALLPFLATREEADTPGPSIDR